MTADDPDRAPWSTADVSAWQVLTPLVRRWRLVAAVPAVFGVAAAIVSLLMPPVYQASTSFTPAAPTAPGLASSLGGLAGLAGQLGLGTPTGSATPEFFASVLESRELLDTLLRTAFRDPRDGARRPLLALLDIDGRTQPERVSLGIRRLRTLTSENVDGRTGIVTVTVRQGDAQLAADVANRLTDLLNGFNLERRQSQSREQARFTAQRLTEAEQELRGAEGALQRFLLANRQYRGSPLLEFEYARLDRVVQLRQEVVSSLAKAHEEARIAEVRDTPVLTIIDRAVPPHRRSAPRRRLYVMIALLVGGAIGAVAAYGVDLRERASARTDYRELAEAVQRARADLRALLRRRA